MKYSIHRVLALRKSTIDRIDKSIGNLKFIDIAQGKSKKIKGVDIEDVKKSIIDNWNRVESLINNYIKIKRALLASNAGISSDTIVETVQIMGHNYTMAELIDIMQNVYGLNGSHFSRGYKDRLLTEIMSQYNEALNKVEMQKQRVDDQIRDYLMKAAQNDKQLSTEDIEKRTQMFKEDGEYQLIDPLNLKSRIEKLSKEIQQFRDECDAIMSEHNALTVLEIDLADID